MSVSQNLPEGSSNILQICASEQFRYDILNSCESLVITVINTISNTIEHIKQNLILSWSKVLSSNTETDISDLTFQQLQLEADIKQLLDNFRTTCTEKSNLVLNHLRQINQLRLEYENKLKNYQQQLTQLGDNGDDRNKLILSELEKQKDDSRKLYHKNVIMYNGEVLKLQLLLDYFEQGLITLDETAVSPVFLYKLLDDYKSICKIPGQSTEINRQNNDMFDSWKSNLQSLSSIHLPTISPKFDQVLQINLDEANMNPSIDPREQNVATSPRSSASPIEENTGIHQVKHKHDENESLIKNVRLTYLGIHRRNNFLIRNNLIEEKHEELQTLNNDIQSLSSQWRRISPDPQDRIRYRGEPVERRRVSRIPATEGVTMKSITASVKAIMETRKKLEVCLSIVDDDLRKINQLQTLLTTLHTKIGVVHKDEQNLMDEEEQINKQLQELKRRAMQFSVDTRTFRKFIIENERKLTSTMENFREKLNQKKLRLELRIAGRPQGS